MGRPVESPYTIAFECSGNARAAEAALDQLDYAGTLVFVGTGRELPRVNHNRAIVLELTIIGAYNYDDDGFSAALALLASGRLPVEQLIEADDVVLDGLLPTMHRLAAGELPGKVMVSPNGDRG
jgi:threonine dehydrogenase-like Zn-dependent dehydrogenase